MTDRKHLAERARQHADQAWLDGRAWLSVAVAVGTTSTTAAARKALAGIPIVSVRDRAAELLGRLLTADLSAQGGATKEGTTP
jgi:hypothetical protein